MLGRLALLLTAAVGLTAPPADAQLRALGTGSPVLFGDRVLWSAGALVFAAPAAGGDGSVFGTLPAPAAALAAGPGVVAAEAGDQVFSAGADGAFRQIGRAGDAPLSLAIPRLGVTAAGVLSVQGGGAFLLDGAGRARELVLPPGALPDDVAAAGDLGVVPTPDGALVVFDLRTGTEQRQIALGALNAETVNGLAISPQGDVAVTLATGDGDDALLWAPAGATRARELSKGRTYTSVAVAGGRVAYVTGDGLREGERAVVVDPLTRREVFRGPPAAVIRALSFDGARVAFEAAGCAFAGPAAPSGSRATLPPGPCARSDATVDTALQLVRGDRYRLRVGCVNAPDRRCSVRVRLRTRSGAPAGGVSTRLRAGSARVLEVPLNPRGRRARPDRLRLTVTLVDPDGRSRLVYDL